MFIPPAAYTLSDGRVVRFRTPDVEDAATYARLFELIVGSTAYLTRNADEIADIGAFVMADIQSTAKPHHTLLVGYVDDVMVAIGRLDVVPRAKLRHRAQLGMAVHPGYMGKGIGYALTLALEDAARKMGVRVLELQYIEGNEQARKLYTKAGFTAFGAIPDGVCMPDGTYRPLVMMRKVL